MKQRFPWTRLILCLLGQAVLYGTFCDAMRHIYALPTEKLTVFCTITVNYFYATSVLVVFAVAGKMVWDWKQTTATELVNKAETLFEIPAKFATEELKQRYADR